MITVHSSLRPFINRIQFWKSFLYGQTRRRIPWPHNATLSRPIFIIGSSRSGTSMLTRILGASPDLCYFPENSIVRRHMWRMVQEPSAISDELPKLEKTLIRLSGVHTGQRLLEKTPGHSLLADSLADYFSDAQFIHIIRDGRDVASSMLKHPWIAAELQEVHSVFWFRLLPETFKKEWQQLSVWQRGVLRWAVYVNSARQIYSSSGRYLEISYEDICRSPNECFQSILCFLKLQEFQDLNCQLSEIKPHRIERWRSDGLIPEQLEFYQRVKSTFNFKVEIDL